MRRGIIIGAAVLLIIGVILGKVLRSRPEVETTPVEEIKIVKVIEAERGNMQSFLSATGTVYPWQEAKIESKVVGKIEKFLVKEGDEVEKGELLVQLEKTERLIALAQAEANFENAEGDWKRMEELYAKKTISQQQYDKGRSVYKMAKANLDMAQTQLDNCDIRAPFSGVIVQKFRNEGEMVAQPMGMPGIPPLVVLMDISRVKVGVDIAEKRIGEVKVDQRAQVRVDGYPGRAFEGRVIDVVPFVNPLSRTFKVKIEILNQNRLLKSGMFARARIVTDQREDSLVLPACAVLEKNEEKIVYLVAGSRAKIRRVETGLVTEDEVEIISGVDPGDIVIVNGHFGLRDGAEVSLSQGGKE